jgi:hypothetical protein
MLGGLLAVGAVFGLSGDGADDAAGDADGEGDIAESDVPDQDVGSVLDIGRPPMILHLMALSLSFGGVGLAVQYLAGSGRSSNVGTVISVSVATVAAWIFGRALRRVFTRHVRSIETEIIHRRDLVGALGSAVVPIASHRGVALVRDMRGDVHQVTCRAPRESSPLPRGTPILIIDYDADNDIFEVTRRPDVLR